MSREISSPHEVQEQEEESGSRSSFSLQRLRRKNSVPVDSPRQSFQAFSKTEIGNQVISFEDELSKLKDDEDMDSMLRLQNSSMLRFQNDLLQVALKTSSRLWPLRARARVCV